MLVLVACEKSGVVRDAFRAVGHNAYSCDTQDADSQYHIKADVMEILSAYAWDLMIAHPPCTYLCSSGLHWNKRVEGRDAKTDKALDFVSILLNSRIPMIALENPVGCISTRIRKPDQYIQPYEYGHDASKKTGLWLKNLPRLVPTRQVEPRMVDGLPRWANQTDSGQNRLGPSEDRGAIRAVTYTGIAEAMADQWGGFPSE